MTVMRSRPLACLAAALGLLAATPADPLPRYEVRALGAGVYLVSGEVGRGSEGRPNAGFVVTRDGVVVIDALGTPLEGRALVAAIRRTTSAPIRWLVLTHHHPDHSFGAVELRRAGARVLAHPDLTMLAAENGWDNLTADWVRTRGIEAMRGFVYADTADRPVTAGRDSLVLGGRTIHLFHPPSPAHTAGDLAVWIPEARVLFAGDLLIEDGISMVVDGNSALLLGALDSLRAFGATTLVPGHGAVQRDGGGPLIDSTQAYLRTLRREMRAAVERGTSMRRALAPLPEPDETRPVSVNSRLRRNAARVYVEMEREVMGMGSSPAPRPPASVPPPSPVPSPSPSKPLPPIDRDARHGIVSTDSLAAWLARGPVHLLDVRSDVFVYLRGHLPSAQYLHIETLRASERGVPAQLLPEPGYRALFARLGLGDDAPVVVYGTGESANIDATFVAFLLVSSGHPSVWVLDGGLAKWESEHRPLVREYAAIGDTVWPARRAPLPTRLRLQELQLLRLDPQVVLVDARPPEQFAGEAGSQMRLGHIPGAINHYWATDLERVGFGLVWKSPEALRASYLAQGIDPSKAIVVYCNSTTEASHVWWALKILLGYPRVRIYTGAWTEWAGVPTLPVATGR